LSTIFLVLIVFIHYGMNQTQNQSSTPIKWGQEGT
jgi:hypothetical protein